MDPGDRYWKILKKISDMLSKEALRELTYVLLGAAVPEGEFNLDLLQSISSGIQLFREVKNRDCLSPDSRGVEPLCDVLGFIRLEDLAKLLTNRTRIPRYIRSLSQDQSLFSLTNRANSKEYSKQLCNLTSISRDGEAWGQEFERPIAAIRIATMQVSEGDQWTQTDSVKVGQSVEDIFRFVMMLIQAYTANPGGPIEKSRRLLTKVKIPFEALLQELEYDSYGVTEYIYTESSSDPLQVAVEFVLQHLRFVSGCVPGSTELKRKHKEAKRNIETLVEYRKLHWKMMMVIDCSTNLLHLANESTISLANHRGILFWLGKAWQKSIEWNYSLLARIIGGCVMAKVAHKLEIKCPHHDQPLCLHIVDGSLIVERTFFYWQIVLVEMIAIAMGCHLDLELIGIRYKEYKGTQEADSKLEEESKDYAQQIGTAMSREVSHFRDAVVEKAETRNLEAITYLLPTISVEQTSA